MKHNWELRDLSSIGTIVTGCTPSTTVLEYYNQQDYMFIKPGDIDDSGITYLTSSETYISKFAFDNASRKLPKNSVLVTCIGTIGKVGILHEEATCNQQINAIIPFDNVNYKYLGYAIFSIKDILTSKKNGPVVPIINKSQFSKFKIPVPPMEVQQQIVAELDKINEVIEDCRALLRNLDALAQSLFNDNFGDPITNPKNWEIIQLDSLIQPKKNILRASKNFTQNDFITYIDISSINRNSNSISDPSVLVFGDAPSRAQQCVKHGDLLVSLVRPNLKNIALCRLTSNSLVASSGFCVLRSNNISNPYFLLHLLLSASTTEYLCSKISGAAYPAITENDIRDMLVPVPPLELQEKFSERIEQIDAQKATVEETIANLQTLLDSRMDYWFNNI